MDRNISVYLVDDHVMVREGLAGLVAQDPQLTVVGQCGDGLKVFGEVQKLKPDVVVLDVCLPGMNGLDVCRELTRRLKKVAVLILSAYDDEQFVIRSFKNGALGFVLKDFADKQLTQGIHAVASGQQYIDPAVGRQAVSGIDDSADTKAALRQKEKEFAHLLASAKKVLNTLSAKRKKFAASQKPDVETALKAVQAARAMKPGDTKAHALEMKAYSYLGFKKERVLDLGNNVSMKLVLIPAGTFLMGSPGSDHSRWANECPQHEVAITKPFYMGIYEVTQEQYEVVMDKNPSHFDGAANPVERISWGEAVAFCETLSKRTGKMVRLPTEAQWEYACRAGTATPFNSGETISSDQAKYDARLVHDDDTQGGASQKTTPVGGFKPNGFGLYDMHGNVWEWCSDWYGGYSDKKETDPQGPTSGQYHVLRGGSWCDGPWVCRSAVRTWFSPGIRDDYIGFRVVMLAE